MSPEHDARVRVDLLRDEQVPAAEAQRERGLAQEARRHDTAGALVARRRIVLAAGRLDFALLAVHDRESAQVFTEVDVRLRDLEIGIAGRRDVRQEVVGRLIGLDRVAGRGDRSVSVRVREVLVDPGRARKLPGVQLTDRDLDLQLLVADRIPVEVEVGEREVRPELLVLLQVGLELIGIPQPHVVERRLVRLDDRGGEVLLVGVALRLDVVDPEREARRLEVAIDVGLLLGELVRLHLEALDVRGVDRADDDRDESPQADGDHRKHPTAAPDVHDEQRGRRDRDEEQEVQVRAAEPSHR